MKNTSTQVISILQEQEKRNKKAEDLLQQILQEGARKMLQSAVESEVSDYIDGNKHILDAKGHRMVVRNGSHPERNIQTGLGDIPVKKPKVNDKRMDDHGDRMQFKSSIIPPYLRRTKSVEELIPWLYLRGISSGDFNSALESLLGENARGLSATNVVRLKQEWEKEHEEWSERSLEGKEYVYIWADGIYPKVRLEKGKPGCFLVIMGATADGKKELISITQGERESEATWTSILLGLKRRGLTTPPKLAVGDGAIGFWAALEKVFPDTAHQRCWVHKTANILNKLPKSEHANAKSMLHDIWKANTKKAAIKAYQDFIDVYGVKQEKAVECLKKDIAELLAFYDFPAEHWKHIRTTNPIESAFATIRLRTKRTKGHGSSKAALAMVFKLAQCAEQRWRKLSGHKLLADVISVDFKFVDGVKEKVAA